MKVQREAAVAMLQEMGYPMAPKWDNDRLSVKLKTIIKMKEADALDKHPESDESKALLEKVLASDKDEFEVTGDDKDAKAAAPKKKGGKAAKPSKNGKPNKSGGASRCGPREGGEAYRVFTCFGNTPTKTVEQVAKKMGLTEGRINLHLRFWEKKAGVKITKKGDKFAAALG
jgi:hypothetical protein